MFLVQLIQYLLIFLLMYKVCQKSKNWSHKNISLQFHLKNSSPWWISSCWSNLLTHLTWLWSPPPLKYQESHAAENHSRGAWSYGRGQGIKIKGGKLVVWTWHEIFASLVQFLFWHPSYNWTSSLLIRLHLHPVAMISVLDEVTQGLVILSYHLSYFLYVFCEAYQIILANDSWWKELEIKI